MPPTTSVRTSTVLTVIANQPAPLMWFQPYQPPIIGVPLLQQRASGSANGQRLRRDVPQQPERRSSTRGSLRPAGRSVRGVPDRVRAGGGGTSVGRRDRCCGDACGDPVGDLAGPGRHGGPVPEVPEGGAHGGDHRAFTEGEPGPVQAAGEHTVSPW